MARDITMDLREEAIAAADIDSEDDTPNQLGSYTGDTGSTARPLAIDVSTDKRPASPLLNEQRTRRRISSPFTSSSTEHTAAAGKKRRAGTNRQDEDRGDEELDEAGVARDGSPSRAMAPTTVLAHDTGSNQRRTREDDAILLTPIGERVTPPVPGLEAEARGRANADEVRSQPSTRGSTSMETRPAGEDDEPVVYVFAGRGRRGVDSLVSLQPRIPRLQPNEKVMECRQRRYRTRTGRYAMEFEVQRLGSDLISGSDKLWINQRDYE
ncbi:unnamed protein product [Phytophthora fragariaefolia]|uniref:Unnamed protein product n=1 Tax=Phytophthora fragariaefolia TaxID=1490495 RepID=A0A9W6UC35_9STRA|nr:unnamed protein product [Phytophthora fragariaefolia]